ncbi:MAG: TssQ family T6SS-associated lipoprotein [Burkholderiaceae bacterium]|nr:TssQ family T6SS-associated lipoprotein [Burkholderiaceae bacterium]
MKPLIPVALAILVVGCATTPPPRPGLLDVVARPAEQALLVGLRAYEDAQYVDAEKQFSLALKLGLPSPKDRAAADKHLAFIYCTSNRVTECETAFRAARAADPGFSLSKSEAGHPLWGPVYRRVQP